MGVGQAMLLDFERSVIDPAIQVNLPDFSVGYQLVHLVCSRARNGQQTNDVGV